MVMLLFAIVLFISLQLIAALNAETDDGLYRGMDCSGRPYGCYGTSECGPEYFCCRRLLEPVVYRCSAPLVWEQKTRSCRWKSLTEGCQEKPKKAKRSSVPFIQRGESIVMKTEPYVCRGKQDGRYSNPESPCSSFFIICYDDAEYLVSCTKGYRFSSASESCLPAEEIKECAASTYIFGKYRGEISPVKLTFSCAGRKDGNYENPSNPCSRRFFSCTKGTADLRFCPKQARFDRDIDNCNFPEYVRSCGGSTTMTPSVTTASEKQQGKRKPQAAKTQAKAVNKPATLSMFRCDEKDDGQYPDPEKACSSRYFTCLSGFTFPRQCPPSLFFDPAIMACTFRQYITACGGSPTTTTEMTTAASMDEILAPDFNCDELPLGVYADPGDSCSQVFYTCVGSSNAIKMLCPKGTLFDERKSSCNFPSEMPECAKQSTKTAGRGNKRAGEQHREEVNETFGYSEKPCSRFYYQFTNSKRLRKRSCNESQFFDSKSKQCLNRKDVASCSEDALSDDASSRLPFDCKYLQNGNYLPPGIACPSFYYKCEDKKTFLTSCPTDWIYNMENNACESKKDVPGCEQSKVTYCEKKQNGFYQDLRYCSRFHFCLDGEDMTFDCGDGDVFDRRSKACLPVSKASPPCGTKQGTFHCKGKSRGYYANPLDCTKYFFCKNNRMSLLECEEGRGYHPEKMRCVPLSEVPDCIDKRSASATPDKDSFCGERDANALKANPADPSEAILCVQQNAYFMKCGSEAKPLFDPKSLTCIPKEEMDPRNSEDGTRSYLVKRKMEGPLFDCTKKANGSYAPSERGCTSYFYECMNGVPFLVRCPEDMMFSSKQLKCVELSPHSDCWTQVTETPCYNRASGFYPHPRDCSKYLICISGRILRLSCPDGSVYDPQSKTCLPGEQVDLPCGRNEMTLPFRCDEKDDYVFEDHTDPSHFYKCTGGRPIRYACQDGYKYNKTALRCEINDKLFSMDPAERCNVKKYGLYADIRNCGSMILCSNGTPYLIVCRDEDRLVLNPETVSCVQSFQGCDVQ